MKKCIYVGNLPRECTEDQVRALFAADDREVAKVSIVTDKKTGRSRGFGFVEMATEEAAAAAMEFVKGQSIDGNELKLGRAYNEKMGSGTGRSQDYGNDYRPSGRRRGRR